MRYNFAAPRTPTRRSAKIKQVIGLGTAGATYVFLQNFMKDELYSPMGPVLFAGVMAYYVASSFSALLGMVRRNKKDVPEDRTTMSRSFTHARGRDKKLFVENRFLEPEQKN